MSSLFLYNICKSSNLKLLTYGRTRNAHLLRHYNNLLTPPKWTNLFFQTSYFHKDSAEFKKTTFPDQCSSTGNNQSVLNTGSSGATKLPTAATASTTQTRPHSGHIYHISLDDDNNNKKKSDGKSKLMTKIIFQHIWPEGKWGVKGRVMTAVSLLVGAKLLNVQVPFVFKHLVDHVNANAGNLLNFNDAPTTIITSFTALVLAYGLARAGASGMNELRNVLFAKVSQSSNRELSNKVILHLLSLDSKFHLSRQTGALFKAIDRGTRGLQFILGAIVFNIVPTIFEVGLVTGILYYKCGMEYAAVSLGCIGLYTAYTLSVTSWRTKFRVQMNKADQEAGNKAVDSLINYETVKYFGNEKYEAERYDKIQAKYEQASLKTTTSLALLNFGQNAIFSTGLTIFMYLASKSILEGTMGVGDLVMVNGLLFQLSIPLNFLGSVYRETKQAVTDMESMFNLLQLETSIKNAPNAMPLVISPQTSSIVFDNVRFGYNDKEILKGVSFEVPAGKKIAIVGGSGSGKSTIIRLLYRLLDPSSGHVLVNGQDVRTVDLDSLRKVIGIVPQDSVLFNDTIHYNIRYGRMDCSDHDVYTASKLVDLADVIESMPEKYETQVGERGLKLSGGEKQRVSIARAILKDPLILAYDEATSSLDTITEQKILKALNNATENRTTIVIAHRLSTVVDADCIYVLHKGSIVESGSHNQLLSDPTSLYSELWNKQHEAALNPTTGGNGASGSSTNNKRNGGGTESGCTECL